MILALKPVSGGELFEPVADESDRVTTLGVLSISFESRVQVSPIVRADTPALHRRGNTAASLGIAIAVTYATLDEALAAIETFNGYFGTAYHLQITQGDTLHYYPSGLMTGYTPEFMGLTVIHRMQWIAQNLQTTEP